MLNIVVKHVRPFYDIAYLVVYISLAIAIAHLSRDRPSAIGAHIYVYM